MTPRNLYTLVAIMLVLGAVFYFTKSDFDSVSDTTSDSLVRLLENQKGEEVNTILIEQGSDLLEIRKEGNQWVVASKDSYPADAGKVGSLMLKLFDLQTSQRVPTAPGSAEKLGLAPESIKKERYIKISLLSAKGEVLGGLRLGKLRQQKKQTAAGGSAGFSAAGQYVRRLDEEQVYVIGLPINVSANAAEWVQTSILNAPSANVLQVEHIAIQGEEYTGLISLARESSEDGFTLDGPVPDGEEVQESVLSQLASALENLRLVDVSKHSGDFTPDRKAVYRLNNGAVYTVETVAKGENALGRIRVVRDSEWVAQLKSRTEEQTSNVSNSGSDEENGQEISHTSDGTDDLPTLSIVSQEEIDKQNARFEPWLFEFPAYQAMKFRRERSDLFKKKDK